MARDASSFKRGAARYAPQPTVLVICEDLKSSKNYLEDVAIDFRVKVHVEISHRGKTDPLGIVEEAIDEQKKFDRVYCAIDRDNHANFDAALRKASKHLNV